MRILWIVNVVMPDLARHLNVPIPKSGSWLFNLSKRLSSTGNNLAIACVFGKQFRKIDVNGITYYLLPGNGKKMLFYCKAFEKLWHRVYEDFRPEIVNIHGTEYSHGLSFMREFPNIPTIISLQGIINKIKDVDFGEIPVWNFMFGRTIKQWLHFNGEIENHFIHKKNAKYEKEMFCRARAICGSNLWDTSFVLSINPNVDMYKVEYVLREGFYKSQKWDINSVSRHTIFTNPGGTPLKGLHVLLRAVALLKDKYPDIKVMVPGMAGEGGNIKVNSAYARYLHGIISRYELIDHVVFLGEQTEQGMIHNILNAHLTVIPSAIEGTSLILRESMFLGCPCIASFRGGMADFISDKVDGFLYDFSEYSYLAQRISLLFSDDDLCNLISANAIKKAELNHNINNNEKDVMGIYRSVIDNWESN